MGTKWNEYYLEQRERTNEELLAEKNKERQEYPIGEDSLSKKLLKLKKRDVLSLLNTIQAWQ